jgi:pilus assembly protein CpaB
VQQKGDAATNQVVVAAVDIELGSRITPMMTKAVPWPSGNVPPGVFSKPEDVSDRVVKTSVLRGEAILDSKLAPVGTQGGLSAVIKEGNRAMTVRVNDVIGVAGFALPGNYVDVVVSTQQDDNKSKQISKIVLEHILVLAVAQEASRDETKPKVVSAVTLEVTPAQAERLDLARSVGTLSLVLRNQVDAQPSETAGVTKQQLLGEQPQPPLVKVAANAAPRPARPARSARAASKAVTNRVCVEVIKGGRRTTECF